MRMNLTILERELLEEPFRNRAYEYHDQAPEPGQIDHVGVAIDGLDDAAANRLGAGEERVLGQVVRGHGRVDEAGFNGQDPYARLRHPLAQRGEVPVEPCFRRRVDAVRL